MNAIYEYWASLHGAFLLARSFEDLESSINEAKEKGVSSELPLGFVGKT